MSASALVLSPLALRTVQALAHEQQTRAGQAVPLVRIAKLLDAGASTLLRELAMLNRTVVQTQQASAWVLVEAVDGRWMLALTPQGAAAVQALVLPAT